MPSNLRWNFRYVISLFFYIYIILKKKKKRKLWSKEVSYQLPICFQIFKVHWSVNEWKDKKEKRNEISKRKILFICYKNLGTMSIPIFGFEIHTHTHTKEWIRAKNICQDSFICNQWKRVHKWSIYFHPKLFPCGPFDLPFNHNLPFSKRSRTQGWTEGTEFQSEARIQHYSVYILKKID